MFLSICQRYITDHHVHNNYFAEYLSMAISGQSNILLNDINNQAHELFLYK